MNKYSASEGKREFSVQVTFSNVNIPSVVCDDVTIKRKGYFKSGIDEFEIYVEGHLNELTKEVGDELFIQDFLLPREIGQNRMEITINHLACSHDWETHHYEVPAPKCLVLGSFNPKIDSNSGVPFYYCRPPERGGGNRLWPTVTKALSMEKNCRENEHARLAAMQRGKFIFMDLIDSLTISSANSGATELYHDTEIASFSDSALWASRSKGITIHRTYNTRIFDVIKRYRESLQYVVFTLGPTGLDPLIKRNNHGSLSRRDKQWVQFYSQLVEICTFIDTLTLVTETCSPAPQGCSNERLRDWLKTYVIHE